MKTLNKKQTNEILNILEVMFPEAKAELVHTNPFELLIATILSAQTTDVRVNLVTESLFKELKTPEDYIKMGEDELAERIRSIGFFNTKSRNIIATCHRLIDEYGGEVPDNMEDLVTLPGVGRKTANVVLSVAFGVPAIAVDTHVFRVTNRLGVVAEKDVVATEEALMKKIDKKRWSKAHHLFIFLGRYMCKARRPECERCDLNEICMKRI